jgi:ABC-2 type transport system ATP-binding protein
VRHASAPHQRARSRPGPPEPGTAPPEPGTGPPEPGTTPPEPAAGEEGGTASGTAIATVGLCKTYQTVRGDVAALRGVDLTVATGEFFGLLGPNGAGKSTAIGVLTTLVKPTAGRARVWHRDVTTDPIGVRRHIGVTTQGPNFDRFLTVAENLEFRARYCGMRGREARARALELLEEFDLGDRRTAHVHELSGGQAKRLMIARALVQRPRVLFLDEPTAGIDPQTRLHVWDILRKLHADGMTILLTTHYLEEAEELCQRIAVLDHGRVLACGTLDDLISELGADTVVTVAYDGAPPAELAGLAGRGGIRRVEITGRQARIFARTTDGLLRAVVGVSADAGVPVDVTTVRPSLESVFLTLTGRDYRE